MTVNPKDKGLQPFDDDDLKLAIVGTGADKSLDCNPPVHPPRQFGGTCVKINRYTNDWSVIIIAYWFPDSSIQILQMACTGAYRMACEGLPRLPPLASSTRSAAKKSPAAIITVISAPTRRVPLDIQYRCMSLYGQCSRPLISVVLMIP